MESYQLSWIYGEFLSICSWCFLWVFFFVLGFFEAPTSVRACVCGCIMAVGLRVAPKRMLSQVIGEGNICMNFIEPLIAASIMSRCYEDLKRK